MPGLIEAHSTSCCIRTTRRRGTIRSREHLSLRVARATNHLRDTLLAGFTTVRDLGTEGADYADVGLKQAVQQGIIPGPRMLVATRAIVASEVTARKVTPRNGMCRKGAEERTALTA